jgi:AP-4 complex subunit mu-1
MLSQFFILSARGDTIISRDFRGDLVKGTNEIFFRKAKLYKGDLPPAINLEGINFLHLKKGGLYLLATTIRNVSPSYVFDLLMHVAKMIKDYCGVLTEESIRKNFVLIYEIIDEAIDYGYAQSTSTDQVRPFIVNEAVAVTSSLFSFRPSFMTTSAPYTAVQRPMTSKKNKNEIFVDVYEKITALFNVSGYLINSSIDGCIQMKSYLQENPQLKLALNEDLVVDKSSGGYGNVGLDDFNFHECVDVSEFKDYKILTINPPEGEFVLMNYRIKGEYQTPFKIFYFVDEITPYKFDFTIKIRALFSEKQFGSNLLIKYNLPKTTNSVAFEVAGKPTGHKAEYKELEKVAEWSVKKVVGGTELGLKTKASLNSPCNPKEVGQISMAFEIPMYSVSNLQIKYLRIVEQGKPTNPYRWVRYITQSSSYVCRI